MNYYNTFNANKTPQNFKYIFKILKFLKSPETNEYIDSALMSKLEAVNNGGDSWIPTVKQLFKKKS